jgi:hypothetical protein
MGNILYKIVKFSRAFKRLTILKTGNEKKKMLIYNWVSFIS